MLEKPGSQVWGVLWELDTEHSETLDQQEGVPTVYNKKTVNVILEDGSAQVPAQTWSSLLDTIYNNAIWHHFMKKT